MKKGIKGVFEGDNNKGSSMWFDQNFKHSKSKLLELKWLGLG